MNRTAPSLPQNIAEESLLTDELDDPFAGILGSSSASDALWLGKTAPRYTSYPPATAFRDDVTVEDYRRLLSSLPDDDPVSLYLHIPFCQKLCLYCACHTMPTTQHERISDYLHILQRELEYLSHTSATPRRISHLHFGGGSPNIMSEKDIGMMIGALARRFNLDSLGEIAMELDPRLVTKAQARVLGLVGVNRVSLGIQDLDPDVQEAIGRVHSYAQVAEVCLLLRNAGIRKISFDLMYGLPLQSPSTLADTVRLATTLKPDRIALFSYAHIPQIKKQQVALEQFILPGPHATLALESAARSILLQEGYVEIGMDHFALPDDSLVKAQKEGRLRRSFQGYTDDGASTLLGLGASSIGRIGDCYVQNATDVDAYRERIAKDGFATMRGLRLSGEDKLRGAIIQELMCSLSVNLETVCSTHNFSLSSMTAPLEALKPYEEAGLVRREGYRITLSTPHRMAIRVVASLFDAYPRDEKAAMSKVV